MKLWEGVPKDSPDRPVADPEALPASAAKTTTFGSGFPVWSTTRAETVGPGAASESSGITAASTPPAKPPPFIPPSDPGPGRDG